MVHIPALDLSLAEALRKLSFRHRNRYGDAARAELLEILFRSLANNNELNLKYFFPDGVSGFQADDWNLSQTQGAVDGAEYTEAARGKRCGHILRNGESSFACRTCGTDETCVLCARCFEASDHEGHQIIVTLSSGMSGCCDCGDPEAWVRPVHCSIHSEDPNTTATNRREGKQRQPLVPDELKGSIRTTISRAVDFLCDTFSCSQADMRPPKQNVPILQNEEASRLISKFYQGTHSSERDEEFALVLWNDEKHAYDEVEEQVAKACKRSKTFGKDRAAEVDVVGRSILAFSKDVDDLIKKATIIAQLSLTVTIRSARDTFREQMCATIVEWLSDVSGCSICGDNNYLVDVICEELLRPWRRGSEAPNLQIARQATIDHQKSDDRLEDIRNLRISRANARQMARLQALLGAQRAVAANNPNTALQAMNTANELNTVDEDDDEDEDHPDEEYMDVDEPVEGETGGMQLNEADSALWLANEGINIVEPQDLPPHNSGLRAREYTPENDSDEEMSENTNSRNPDQLNMEIPATPKVWQAQNIVPPAYWTESQKPWTKAEDKLITPAYEDMDRRVRMDFLILYDLRLWKKLRNDLRDLYIGTVIKRPDFKRILGLRLAALYPVLAQFYLIADREPEQSVINLSLQMLTTPSITSEAVERGNFFARLLAILYTFLSRRQVGSPAEVDLRAVLAFDAGTLTNRRVFHFMQDVRHLLDSSCVKAKLRMEPQYLLQFLDLAKLFQGICPNVRAVGEHVEYESEAWMHAYYMVREIIRMVRHICEAFKWRRDQVQDAFAICRAITETAKITIINSIGAERERFTQAEIKDEVKFKLAPPFAFEAIDGRKPDDLRKLVDFKIEQEHMSFYHPLHYTLSWLMEAGKSMSAKQLLSQLTFEQPQLQRSESLRSTNIQVPELTPVQYLLTLFDYPLRTCAWLAQMRAGMWVRNGVTLKHQMSTYQGIAQRALSYQRDLFLLQVAYVVLPDGYLLASMVDRFGLDSWMRGNPKAAEGFDEQQMIDILEEFLHLLIILLSDRTLLHPVEDHPSQLALTARRDIVHVLCFKPLTYTDLLNRLSDKVTEQAGFQDVLHEVATYRPPEGTSDSGTYRLKESCFTEIDPYNPHFSKSQREEAEQMYRNRKAKEIGQSAENIFYIPTLAHIKSGIFSRLGQLSNEAIFAQIIHSSLRLVLGHKESLPQVPQSRIESLFHTLLHIILVAILGDETKEGNKQNAGPKKLSFLDYAEHEVTSSSQDRSTTSIMEQLVLALKLEGFSSSKLRTNFVFGHLRERRPRAVEDLFANPAHRAERQLIQNSNDTSSAQQLSEKRKKALERQAKVMESFRQQQQQFLDNQNVDFGEDLSDLDDMDTEVTSPGSTWHYPSGTCIFCQEETKENQLYGTLAHMTTSNVFRQTPLDDEEYVREIGEIPLSLDRSDELKRPFGVADKNIQDTTKVNGAGEAITYHRRILGKGFPSDYHKEGLVVTSCGHLMHYACFNTYEEATTRRHSYQVARDHPERLEKKEYVCPLCKALGNIFLPVLWKSSAPSIIEKHDLEELTRWVAANANSPISGPAFPLQEYASKFFVPSLAEDFSRHTQLSQGSSNHSFIATSRLSSAISGLTSLASFASGVRTLGAQSVQQPLSVTEVAKAYRRLDETMQHNSFSGGVLSLAEKTFSRQALCYSDTLAEALGCSIAATEISLRGGSPLSNSIVNQLTESQLSHLRVFSQTVSSYVALAAAHNPSDITRIAQVQLRQLLGADLENFRPSRPFICHDIFVFFVECIVCTVPSLGLDVHHILQLCFFAELVKATVAIMASPQNFLNIASEIAPSQYHPQAFSVFAQYMLAQCRSAEQSHNFNFRQSPFNYLSDDPNERFAFDAVLHLALSRYALPFLRKATLFLYVYLNTEISDNGALNVDSPELERLGQALGLPSIDKLVDTFVSDTEAATMLRGLTDQWIFEWVLLHSRGRTNAELSVPHPGVFELVALPETHDGLSIAVMSRRCPTTGRELGDPHLCLFCGDVFCGQSGCCSSQDRNLGGCHRHMARCARSYGMFLNIRKCSVLFLNGDHGSFMTAPYMDQHGEVESAFRRKHQLFLNRRRYDQLFRDVWLNHGIATAISRKLEAEVNTGGWETI